MDLKEFGVYITKLRENSGFKSQRQLALTAGVAPATLSRIESGTQEPTPSTLKKLSRHLKEVEYEDLLNAAGYLDDSGYEKELNKTNEQDNTYDSLTEITKIVKDLGLEQFGFFDIEKWKNLSPEDVEEIRKHFEWVAHKAKERNEEK